MVPEGRRVFANLTVLENLRIGAYLRKDKDAIEEDIDEQQRKLTPGIIIGGIVILVVVLAIYTGILYAMFGSQLGL